MEELLRSGPRTSLRHARRLVSAGDGHAHASASRGVGIAVIWPTGRIMRSIRYRPGCEAPLRRVRWCRFLCRGKQTCGWRRRVRRPVNRGFADCEPACTARARRARPSVATEGGPCPSRMPRDLVIPDPAGSSDPTKQLDLRHGVTSRTTPGQTREHDRHRPRMARGIRRRRRAAVGTASAVRVREDLQTGPGRRPVSGFDTMEAYRAWCDAHVPAWLGYGR